MTYDLAIVGSGFAGSITAAIAQRVGLRVVLLEKGRHPRFVIGESTTPLANLMLEEIGSRYDLPWLRELAKWGVWQHTHPEVGCGLKRGFSFFHHRFDHPLDPGGRDSQLLVAASPHDRIADTHWYRPDFDLFLLHRAIETGARYIDRVDLQAPGFDDDGVTLRGKHPDGPVEIRARFLIDASGQRGYLFRSLDIPELPLRRLPPTQTLYTQFRNVRRLKDLGVPPAGSAPPYPVDDAAMHHVFDGGWIWVLHFNNGITSAGVSASDHLADEVGLSEGEPAWSRLLQRLPTVAAQFESAEPVLPFVHARRMSFRAGRVAGSRWVMLPSAAGFVDPLLSMGFAMTLKGILNIAEILGESWGTPNLGAVVDAYASETETDLEVAERLIAALYVNLEDFELFSALSLLYFAAVTYDEASWRLGRPGFANGWLMHRHPEFGPEAQACAEGALLRPTGDERRAVVGRIARTVGMIDVAGLSRADRRNWFPVDADDLRTAADRLGASTQDIDRMLERTGFLTVEQR